MWEMRRRAGPVQQWVDSIPSPMKANASVALGQDTTFNANQAISTISKPKDIPQNVSKVYGNSLLTTLSAPVNVPDSPLIGTNRFSSSLPHHGRLARDLSLQSDSSHCSSVESLLELRKADPEAILLGLGFGGCSASPQDNGPLSRIPKRFLQPSKLKGIAIGDFVKQQQESSESFDSVSLGYRGLTGNSNGTLNVPMYKRRRRYSGPSNFVSFATDVIGSPYVVPSEIVQKIMERLKEHESHELDLSGTSIGGYFNQDSFPRKDGDGGGRASVLSPDNRLFLEQPRSKSPDMRNKRMIIGHRSFAFGRDGDLIEIDPASVKPGSANSSEKLEINDKGDAAASRDKSSKEDTIHEIIGGFSPPTSSSSQMHPCCQNTSLDFTYFSPCPPLDVCIVADKDKVSKDPTKWKERRFSDGTVQVERSCDTKDLILCRRKSLKRQSRVADTYEEYPTDFSQLVEQQLSKDIERKSRIEEDYDDDGTVTTSQSPGIILSESNESIKSKYCNETNQICCYNATMTQNCQHDENFQDCCCHINGKKCWKKMEKILAENKKLEHMVVKNRREMAEIRSMLSNVLSVRMEPGF